VQFVEKKCGKSTQDETGLEHWNVSDPLLDLSVERKPHSSSVSCEKKWLAIDMTTDEALVCAFVLYRAVDSRKVHIGRKVDAMKLLYVEQ
jgi:hypothetical protein